MQMIAGGGGDNAAQTSQAGRPTIIGWIVFLLAMFMLNKSKTGHTLIYWGLVVVAIYLFVANYKRITPLLEHQK